MLALVNFRGVGTPRNDNEGVRWARIAAVQGQATAMALLAEAYEKGAGGSPRSLDEAKIWYRRARDAGNAAAKTALQRLGE
jgi:TPR repeat protein